MKNFLKVTSLLAFLVLMIVACGGGGGSGGGDDGDENGENGTNGVAETVSLSGLELSNGSLVPDFSLSVTSYTVAVNFLTPSVTVTPTTADSGAIITVNDVTVNSGDASNSISLAEGENVITVTVTSASGLASATYTVAATREGASDFAMQAYIKASNTDAGDRFGRGVAIYGDTLAVSAVWEDSSTTGIDGNQDDDTATDSGAVYVFVQSGGTWSQQAYLKASNTEAYDWFGRSVDIYGETIVVGAIGEDSAATGIGGNQADNSASDSGAVYVFTRNGTTWSQEAYIKASNTEMDDWFGREVDVYGDTLVVTSEKEDSSAIGIDGNQAANSASDSGAAYIFSRSGTSWSQQAYIKPSNTGTNDRFGRDAALYGDTLVVGASWEDSSAIGVGGNESDDSSENSGAVYVFTRDGTIWSQQAYIKASNTGAGDFFGRSVSIYDDTMVVGAYYEDSNATGVGGSQDNDSTADSGAAYVFVRNGTTWSQQAYIKASDTTTNDNFGDRVAIFGDVLAVTALGGNATDSGAVYIYIRNGTTWSEGTYMEMSNTGVSELGEGPGVAIEDDTLVTGAHNEDSNATGVGGDPTNDSANGSGAGYVYQ